MTRISRWLLFMVWLLPATGMIWFFLTCGARTDALLWTSEDNGKTDQPA